jgi:hypothetical protein
MLAAEPLRASRGEEEGGEARRGRQPPKVLPLPDHQTCASSRAGACLGDSSASGRRAGELLEVAPLPTLRRRARRQGFLGFGCPPVVGLGRAWEHREAVGPPVEAGTGCAQHRHAPWLRAAGIHRRGGGTTSIEVLGCCCRGEL